MSLTLNYTESSHERAFFDEKTGNLRVSEGSITQIFRGGEARCWIKEPGDRRFKSHRPNTMMNPMKRYSYAFWTNPNREKDRNRSHYSREADAIFRWLQTLPVSITEQVSQVNESLFWGALSILSRIEGAEEIFNDNPAWALLAYYESELQQNTPARFSFSRVRQTFRKPRKSLLTSLGAFRPQSAVNILQKVRLSSLSMTGLETILNFLRSDSSLRKYFEHCDVASIWHFGTALEAIRDSVDGRPRIEISYLRDLENSDRGLQIEHDITYPDIIEMEQHLNIIKKPRFRTVKQMTTYHDELTHTYFKVKGESFRKVELPPPLIPSTNLSCPKGKITITHLSSGDQVIAHGLEQKNCIISYIPRARLGSATIYAVHSDFAPCHTLAIVRKLDGSYTFQCAQAQNKNPDGDVFEAIVNWFRSSQMRH